MKKILMTVVFVVMTGNVYAMDFAALAVNASDLKVLAIGKSDADPSVPKPGAAVQVPVSAAKAPALELVMKREVKFLYNRSADKSTRGCTVKNQSGSIDSWECRNSPGKWRCYAEVEVNGKPFRINGACAESLGDCFWSGSSAVKDPCDSIEDNGGVTPPQPGDTCQVTNQSATIDSWACRDAKGSWRCYADAKINGSAVRIYGGCTDSMSECWSSGALAVDPCN